MQLMQIDEMIKIVFDFWCLKMNHPKSVLDDDRRFIITRALTMYNKDLNFILRAIVGCSISKWHMGNNRSGVKINGLKHILKNAETIEYFEARAPRKIYIPPKIKNNICKEKIQYAKMPDEIRTKLFLNKRSNKNVGTKTILSDVLC